ncbi:restriction endonuclease subunit S [Pseudomonas sp. DWP1b1]|uniref:restriction endonuclease subunit S n=1 Tax=unclassified Pseudomonas TaxID=196821 RepID=UPI003CF3A104
MKLTQIRTAVVFRNNPPQENPDGNVRAVAIRDLVARKPLQWCELPRLSLESKYLSHCLRPGDVVLPSRGDYYQAWFFGGAEEPVFPMGQLNIITPGEGLEGRYLAWYINQPATQAKINVMLTGTGIKALTKAALLSLDIEVPAMDRQKKIAEMDETTEKMAAIRLRLNELDRLETSVLTSLILRQGIGHA